MMTYDTIANIGTFLFIGLLVWLYFKDVGDIGR